jgi:hypothetical protein
LRHIATIRQAPAAVRFIQYPTGRTALYRAGGLGDARTVNQVVGITGSAGAAAATAVVSSIAASGGTIAGIAASSLVPVVGPAIGLVVFGVQQLIANSGCGQTCIVTSQWANQAADALTKNLDAYFALPSPRPKSAQIVCVANFDTIWAQLEKQCGDPQWGDAGRRCISDRQRGACIWRQNQTPGHPGEPAEGECWNWFNGYRDPIALDTDVYDDTAGGLIPAGLPTVAGVSPSVWLPLLAIGFGVALL